MKTKKFIILLAGLCLALVISSGCDRTSVMPPIDPGIVTVADDGDDTLYSNEPVVIHWKGIPWVATYVISYSSDEGINWIPIGEKKEGQLQLEWKIPSGISSLEIRVEGYGIGGTAYPPISQAFSSTLTIISPCVGAKFIIQPQSITTMVGIPVEFKAEMLLHNGELITGKDMEWEITGVGILPSSTFTPTAPGVFDVIARYCDITSEMTKITVFSGPLDHFDCQYNGQEVITVSAKDQYGYDSTISGLVDVWFGIVPGIEDTYGGQLQLSDGYGEYDISGLVLSHGMRYYFKFCLGVCSNFVLDY